MAMTALKGAPVHTCGELPAVGTPAPSFSLTDNNLQSKTLADFHGRRKLLYIVPSLDTPGCAKSTKKFNQQAARVKGDILIVSADLPFAQSRFCGSEHCSAVTTLSTLRGADFLRNYGVEMIDGPLAGLAARAVVVIDEQDRVVYTELVADLVNEPDYEAALAAVGT